MSEATTERLRTVVVMANHPLEPPPEPPTPVVVPPLPPFEPPPFAPKKGRERLRELRETITASKARLAALDARPQPCCYQSRGHPAGLGQGRDGSSNPGIAPGRLWGGGRTEVSWRERPR